MCGITGILQLNAKQRGEAYNLCLHATERLSHRGPDFQHVVTIDEYITLGHARLSIIDTSSGANQPFLSDGGRYALVFNGEIYNFSELKKTHLFDVQFKTTSDTEVLFHLLIKKGIACLHLLSGFFAFAFYDSWEKKGILARDRFGKKPLWYFQDNERFFFSSELKSLEAYGLPQSLNKRSLGRYLLLNYIPGEESIWEEVFKMLPGHYLEFGIAANTINIKQGKWYSLPYNSRLEKRSEDEVKFKIRELVEQAVEKRLVADVPIGAFLSGGIDSSIVSGIAAQKIPKLQTFSIGFSDLPFFDETKYAELCSRTFQTDHHVIDLTNKEMLSHLPSYLDCLDEPFADSSALLLYILCQKAKEKLTVSLSGDGADEVFGGYYKHRAHVMASHPGAIERLVIQLKGLWESLPKSRNSTFSNLARRLNRFAESASMPRLQRYLALCQIGNYLYLSELLQKDYLLEEEDYDYSHLLLFDENDPSMNQELKADVHLVLPYDMLTKVDTASMANGLEVRSPFLDHELVEYAFTLQEDFKVNKKCGKKIIRETFKDLLPKEVLERPKKGFDLPLANWFQYELRDFAIDSVLSGTHITSDGIFRLDKVEYLKKQILSSNKGDSASLLWSLFVFQHFYHKR